VSKRIVLTDWDPHDQGLSLLARCGEQRATRDSKEGHSSGSGFAVIPLYPSVMGTQPRESGVVALTAQGTD
jgi:hypothetical protein